MCGRSGMTKTVLEAIEAAFPFLPKPDQISSHADACAHCEMTEKYLAKHPGPDLPVAATKWLCDELSTLSPEATRWVLASYLRHVAQGGDLVERATEFLIYHFGPAPEHEDETRASLALLSQEQLLALVALIEHLGQAPKWKDYCPEELARARSFLRGLLRWH